MIPVLICDDETFWLQRISKEIENYQIESDLELEVICQASSPEELLTCLEQKRPRLGIYLLDIDLKSSIDGLELGRRIREADPSANLIFITTHEEMVFLALRMSFGVCNYLIKDQSDWPEQLRNSLKSIENFHHSWTREISPSITLQIGGYREVIAKKDIYYIESVKNTHRVQIFLKDGVRDCPGSLSDLEQQLGGKFFLCCRNCLVNSVHVRSFDSRKRMIYLDDGSTLTCSARMCGKIGKYFAAL